MRKSLFALVVLGVAVAAAGCEESNKGTKAPAKSGPAKQVARPSKTTRATTEHSPGSSPVDKSHMVAEGKALYLTACANCHGRDGTGNIMRRMMPNIGDHTSPALHAKFTDDQMADYIGQGRGKMPPFGKIYKRDQLMAIVAYVRTLKKGG